MKFAFLTALLFAATSSFAQTDSTEIRFATVTQSTAITLTRAEIERLPQPHFLNWWRVLFPFLALKALKKNLPMW